MMNTPSTDSVYRDELLALLMFKICRSYAVVDITSRIPLRDGADHVK